MNQSRLSELLAPVLSTQGLELDDLEVVPAGKRRVVRVVVDGDGPQGQGPDLDQISTATRAVSDALDASDAMGDRPYTLEVSSRGVSRPLTRPAHYRRNIGRLLTLTLAGGEQITGRVVAADEESVSLADGEAVASYLLTDVHKAVVQVEMNRRLADDPGETDEEDSGLDATEPDGKE